MKQVLVLVLSFLVPEVSFALGKSINPGLSLGKLYFVKNASEYKDLKWDDTKIYVLPSTPPTIKPIAGILTVSSGSSVSHVQLLARSLGIPNGAITESEYSSFARLHDQEVLYASHPNHTLIVIPKSELSVERFKIIQSYYGEQSIQKIKLADTIEAPKVLIPLSELNYKMAAKIAGPKACNLGTLKQLFPKRVADGFVIPFSTTAKIFSDGGISKYLIRLNTLDNEDEIKKALEFIRIKIQNLSIPQSLADQILAQSKVLADTNRPYGLFIRSDTNVEDLGKFTGAGLNLTIPNVIDQNQILDSIRKVWASPWSERAYAWRKKHVLNSEKILPSVLIMKAVDSKKSGVWVAKSLNTNDPKQMFVSINEGLGFKVVDGLETPEEWTLTGEPANYEETASLMSLEQSANAKTKFVLDAVNGGIKEIPTSLTEIITDREMYQLAKIKQIVMHYFKSEGVSYTMESEFGVDNKGIVQLFQVRPFVENINQKKLKLIDDFFKAS